MQKEGIFWQIQRGEIPSPKAAETLGMRIVKVSPEEGSIEVEFEGREAFTNPVGHIQGGFLSAMLDDTLGPALSATLKQNQFAPTLELKTQYLSPAKPGKLYGYGRIVSRGGRVCFLEGELKQDGALVAKATATAIIREISR